MRKIKKFVTLFICLFLLTAIVACEEEEQKGPSIDLSGVTFESETKEYTGEPLAIIVKNFPGTVKVDYTYKDSTGAEVQNMVEIGVYDITAVLSNKSTGEVLKTLTAQLTIKEKTVVEEVKDKLDAKVKLTFGTEYIEMVKNDDRLIASGVELWAKEEIYFVLDGNDAPLNFITLAAGSLDVASVVDNKLVINTAGSYNISMLFPTTQLQPEILVEPGEGANLYYFSSTANEFATDENTIINADEETNPVTYTVSLQAGDEFFIQNIYGSGFTYSKYFTGMGPFAAGTANGHVKVVETGSYKFTIDIKAKTLTIHKDGQLVETDKNPLFLKGTMNDWSDNPEYQLSKNNGIATITVNLNVNDEFKIANAGWDIQYGLSYFSRASQYFTSSTDQGNVKVLQEGTYTFEIDTNNNKVKVTKDGTVILDPADLPTGVITVYFTVSNAVKEKWGNNEVYCYVWKSGTDGTWPGNKMTFVKTNDYGESIYTCQIDLGSVDMVIFHNNAGLQSADVSLSGVLDNTGFYFLTGDNYSGLGTWPYQG